MLVLGELRRGIEGLRLRDPSGAAALEQGLARLHVSFAERVLDIDGAVADRWGRLNVADPVPTVDGLLAATALVHGLVLVTRNVHDVHRTGVELLNPFSPSGRGGRARRPPWARTGRGGLRAVQRGAPGVAGRKRP